MSLEQVVLNTLTTSITMGELLTTSDVATTTIVAMEGLLRIFVEYHTLEANVRTEGCITSNAVVSYLLLFRALSTHESSDGRSIECVEFELVVTFMARVEFVTAGCEVGT